MRVLSFAFLAGLCCPAWAHACTPPAPATNQMAILTPCSPNLVTANQKTAAALTYISIAAADAMLYGNAHQPVQVHAPGMVNVEVWTHGNLAVRLVNNGSDVFTGTFDTSGEKAGPLPVAFYAWNSAPGNNSYTVQLAARDYIYIRPGSLYVPPFPAAAAGMTLKWAERFNSPTKALSATPCKPGTGVWPHCTAPTAADGFTWYENKAGGGDFGDAAFEHTDSVYNPYAVFTGEFLRIRSTYDPAYVDPYGFKRHWRSGLLSSAFPDGSTNLPPTGDGYYEARILIPNAEAPGNNAASGGTWPAFWTLDRRAITNHAIGNTEWDILEMYGIDRSYLHVNEWDYSPASGPNGAIFQGYPVAGKDLTVDFHRYGLLVKGGMVTAYFDDVPLGTKAEGKLGDGVSPNPFILIDLAMGSGWPVNPPPAGYYDMWVNYVEYYAP